MLRFALLCAVTGFVLIFLTPSESPAQVDTFSITNYRPTHFSQWRWWVLGDASANTNHSASQDSDDERQSATDRSSLTGQFTSSTLRTYYTPDRFGSVFLLLRPTSGYDASRSTYWDNQNYADLRRDSSYRTSWRYGLDGNLTYDHGEYVAGDGYLAVTGSVSARWSETPPYVQNYYDSSHVATVTDEHGSWSSSRRENSSVYREFSISVRPTVGVGRVFEGGYASTAHDMIETLRDAKILVREPDSAEMAMLTDTIHQYRRTVPMDSREHRIAALTAIGQYFEETGILQGDTYRTALLLGDVWDYYPHGGEYLTESGSSLSVPKYYSSMARPFGWRVQGGINVEWKEYSNSESNDEYRTAHGYDVEIDSLGNRDSSDYESIIDEVNTHRNFGKTNRSSVFGSFQWYRPLSYRWQFDFAHDITIYLHNKSTTESDWRNASTQVSSRRSTRVTLYHHFYSLATAANLTYYFDGRNSIVVKFIPTVTHDAATDSTLQNYSDGPVLYRSRTHRTRYSIAAVATYRWRLSVPTTLLATVNANWDRTDKGEHEWQSARSLGIRIQLRHYIL